MPVTSATVRVPSTTATASAQDVTVPHLENLVSSRKKIAKGILHVVKCSPVTGLLNLQLQGPKDTILLSSSSYWQVEFSAENYTPQGEIQPCSDLEGAQGTVLYAEAEGKDAVGQILSIQLRH